MPSIIAKKLKIFLFIMSVLVILVHSLSNVAFLKNFMTIYIQPISVVPFFIISGFLFFRNAYTINDVVKKIGIRIKTLFVPYLLWNIIYYVIYVICKKNIHFSIGDLFLSVATYQYNPTFWFLYQLIILSALTPIIFYILKEKKTANVCFIVLFVMLLIGADVPYINEDAFVYYFFGCFISKYYKEYFYNIKQKYVTLYSFVIALGLFFVVRVFLKLSIYSIYFYNISIILTITQRLAVAIFMYTGLDYICKYKKVLPYMEHSFFIYTIHYMIIRFINNVTKLFTVFHISVFSQNIVEVIIFAISPIIVIIIAYYLYNFMYKKFNKVLMLLTGGR